jgi:CTP:molybdopterin cytidylyltransferase MocA
MGIAAIIVAAGRGTRAGGDLPKQWQMLAGRPVLAHAIDAFRGRVDHLVVVIHPEDRARAAHVAAGVTLVDGGATRDQSVRNALEALAGAGITRVLIHDGARPLVPPIVIERVLAALETHPGAAPALAVTDALWRGAAGVVAVSALDLVALAVHDGLTLDSGWGAVVVACVSLGALVGLGLGALWSVAARTREPIIAVLAGAMALGALLADIFVLPRLYPLLHLGLAAVAVLSAAVAGATAWPPSGARAGFPVAGVAAALGLFGFVFQRLNLRFILLNFIKYIFLFLPLGFERIAFFFEIGNYFVQCSQLLFVVFTLDSLAFNFELTDFTLQFVELLGQGVNFHAQLRCGLVN